ncbi:hypothetical protein TIFTF001_029677 [Ficus carica]|uniref:Uncharacterized protein n=1 Tax=Ficus carica TaxID=3494 RepID=A0AA88DSX4_FICCA|nr:hypothetical protein TIFTF001_029677 [Ficus carica]
MWWPVFLNWNKITFYCIFSSANPRGQAFRITSYIVFFQSLRARTEKALVQKQGEGSNSRAVIKQVLAFMLTEKGAFVRDILLQEFAKGLDALGLAISSAATANMPFGATFTFSRMTDEDRINLRTLHRLLTLLSSIEETDNSSRGIRVGQQKNEETNLEDMSLVLNQLTVRDVLPILFVISELPPESQQQLLNLPADLSGRLISRVAARTIRRMVL